MLVKVQGSRPENIQFLVHEVFESLISESFHGVTYDFFFPCTDCLKVVSTDELRRAKSTKQMFVQSLLGLRGHVLLLRFRGQLIPACFQRPRFVERQS